jgi:uncharacterized protein (TIGR02118 family)
MIRLITLLVRKPGTTHDEFLAHWHERHGPLVRSLASAKYIRRYEQHPAAWPPAGSERAEPEYDGVTIQWFDSVESFWAHLAEPDSKLMMADVERFLDSSKLDWVLCEEPTVVIEDRRSPI